MKRCLIIQTAFIGDVILATGLIESVRKSYPEAKIDFLLRKGNQGLLAGHPHINQVLVWDKTQKKYQHLWQMIKAIRQAKYDWVINVQRFANSGLMAGFSGGKHIVGFQKNPFSFLFNEKVKHDIGNGRHEVERNHDLVTAEVSGSPENPKLYPSIQDFEKVNVYQSKAYVCMAPASVWFTKQLPPAQWQVLIKKAVQEGLTVYLLGGPADRALNDEITAGIEGEIANLAGELSFLESAALMAGASMNYVNDSAPLHIASAMNAPVTAFFCSTIPAFGFGPLSDRSECVEVEEELPCRPCGLHGKKACPEGHFKCGFQIKTPEVNAPF